MAPAVHSVVPSRVYVATWAALIALTAATLGASFLHLGNWVILTALVIAGTKASLVLLYFMHLRYAGRLYAVLLVVAIGTYVVFLALTFSDYSFRTTSP